MTYEPNFKICGYLFRNLDEIYLENCEDISSISFIFKLKCLSLINLKSSRGLDHLNSCKYLEKLRIHSLDPNFEFKCEYIKNCHLLKKIVLTSILVNDIYLLNLPLEFLSVTSLVNSIIYPEHMPKSLNELHLYNSFLQDSNFNCSGLRILELHGCNIYCENLTNLCNLTELHLMKNLCDFNIIDVISELEKLEKIEINTVNLGPINGLLKCKKLKYITIYNSYNHSINKIMEKHPTLECIEIKTYKNTKTFYCK